jgi:Tol biopolymer transport system component
VAFLSTLQQGDVFVADGDLRRGLIGTPRRLTLSDRDDVAYDWTDDSKTLIISSTRSGTWDIFKQQLNADNAEPFLIGPGSQGSPGVTSDGRWILYVNSAPPTNTSIMRVALTGGTPVELVPNLASGGLHCAVHGQCVLFESRDGGLVISSLDPFKGKGIELARTPTETFGLRVRPDGDAFAYILPPDDKGVRNRIRIISFRGNPSRDVIVKDVIRLSGLTWLPTASGFMTSDRGKVLLVLLDGTSKVLWSPAPPLRAVGFSMPSPDEKHLAINVISAQSNVWMVSGF